MAIRTVRGTTVVVTGATSGIGRETALAFAQSGARVVVAGRREERLAEVVETITSRGGEALAVPADVADQAQVAALVERAQAHFGQLNTLVNNAGVSQVVSFDSQSLDDFRRLMDINFWGAVYGCKAALPIMRTQRTGGVIINVSSILGRRGIPFQTAYCASKFALRGFSEALRVEVASAGIDVSTIFPGLVETEMTGTLTNQPGMPVPGGVPARELARVIVQTASFPQPEIIMAMDAQVLDFINTVAPQMLDVFLAQATPFIEGLQEQVTGDRQSNLYAPRRS